MGMSSHLHSADIGAVIAQEIIFESWSPEFSQVADHITFHMTSHGNDPKPGTRCTASFFMFPLNMLTCSSGLLTSGMWTSITQ